MRLAQFSAGARRGVGLVSTTGLIDLTLRVPGSSALLLDWITRWDELKPSIERMTRGVSDDFTLAEVILHAPIARPGKILGMGLNYADHAAEAKMELPTEQFWFAKVVTAINDPYGAIQLPRVSECLDYEAELVFVIGKRCRHVSRSDAPGVIFGYCAGNDVSVRDWQFRTTQVILGKSFDTHAPIGPWIVTADAIDPHNLSIRTLVNGEVRQDSNTKHFIFDCYAMVEHLSKVMTLEPGDVIFTGTPAGVGAVRKPPVWLRAGDKVRVEIEHIGVIESLVVKE